MQLPIKLSFDLMLTKWSSILNPLLANKLNSVSILKNVVLAIGENRVPHLLGDTQQGWFILDVNAAGTIYRSKPFEASFLYLTSSAVATVSIGVF